MTNAPQETYAVEKEYGAKQAARNHESHATPKGVFASIIWQELAHRQYKGLDPGVGMP